MLSIEELGYFLYMEQCDKECEQEKRDRENAAALRKYQVDSNSDLVDGLGTHKEN